MPNTTVSTVKSRSHFSAVSRQAIMTALKWDPALKRFSVQHRSLLYTRYYMCKVVFCRVRTEPYPGIYPWYYPTKNLCKFCRTFIPVPRTSFTCCTTFIPVPGTSVSSVRPCHKYAGYGYSILKPARNFCDICTPVPQ